MESERLGDSGTAHLPGLLQSGGLIPRHEMLYARIVFITFGIASLFMWNTYLSCCGVMGRELFPGMGFVQYIQTSYMTCVLVGNLTMVLGLTHIFDPHHCTVIFNCVGALQSSVVCLSIWFMHGTLTGCLTNLAVAGLVAFSCAILIPETFTLAAIMPESFCSEVSLGQSLSGVVTFGLTIALDLLLPHDISGRKTLVTVMFGISATVSLLAAYMAQSLTKSPWSYSTIAEIRKGSCVGTRREDSFISEDSFASIPISLDTEGGFECRSSYLEVTRQIWPQLYNIFMSFMVTLAVFPTICADWKPSVPDKYSNVFAVMLVGMFHLGDALGRRLPRLGIAVPPSLLWVLTTVRLGFIPLYAAVGRADPGTLLTSIWTQAAIQFALALTNGLSAYLAFIYGPETVYLRRDKEKASFLLAIYNVAGMTAGSWLMNILVWVRYF